MKCSTHRWFFKRKNEKTFLVVVQELRLLLPKSWCSQMKMVLVLVWLSMCMVQIWCLVGITILILRVVRGRVTCVITSKSVKTGGFFLRGEKYNVMVTWGRGNCWFWRWERERKIAANRFKMFHNHANARSTPWTHWIVLLFQNFQRKARTATVQRHCAILNVRVEGSAEINTRMGRRRWRRTSLIIQVDKMHRRRCRSN